MKLKHLLLPLFALALSAGFTACSDDEPTNGGNGQPTESAPTAAYIINQGNSYGGVVGTIDELDFFDEKNWNYHVDVFNQANGKELGKGPQGAVVSGEKIYVPMFDENLVWVLDKASLTAITSIQTNAPEGVCAAGGFVYVSNNDGYVSRIDTTTLSVTAHEAVGPNPAQLTYSNGYVYVSISDGYNYQENYKNGFKVAKINATTGKKEADISVGMNPGPIAADADGNIFVVCRGDYGMTLPKVQKIDATTAKVTDFADGSLIAIDGTTIYAIQSVTDWSAQPATTNISFKSYNTQTGALISDSFIDKANLAPYPTGIDINPATHDIFICNDPDASGYASDGLLYIYKQDGTFREKFTTGIHPVGVVFK